jgi:energy-coupling factor transporter ATP-binding protein EcfA2
MTAPDTPAILVRDLTYRYPDGRPALRGVDLQIPRGSCVALVGPNGAGKSTLLLHLNGILPGSRPSRASFLSHSHDGDDAPTPPSGPSVWIEGLEVNEANAREIRRRVGLLFQDPDDQLFCPSVLADVAFGPLNLGLSRAEARQRALDCLALVGLDPSVVDRPPHHLSFGERKRVCLAGVLACEPTVLVLDEPTANLDPRARRRFLELLAGLPSTKLVATHDLEMALDLCDSVVLLDSGRIASFGPSRPLLSDAELLDRHGLELPVSLQRPL